MRRSAAVVVGLLLACGSPFGHAADEPEAALTAALEAQFRQQWPQAALPSGGDVFEAVKALGRDGQHWQAARLAARHEADLGSSADAAALLARHAAEAGLLDTAQAALQRAAGADRTRLAEAGLAVARAGEAAGQPEATLAALQRMPLRTPADIRNHSAQVEARALLALGRARDAAQVLQNAQFDPLRMVGASADARLEAGTLQYNLALSLIRSGDVPRGRALLERLGRNRDIHPLLLALRDRANLALAGQFLDAGHGANARAFFERVALEGPYANEALLGLGWAALGEQGRGQKVAVNSDRDAAAETPRFVLRAMQRRRLIDCQTFNRRTLAPTELCLEPRHFERAPVPDSVEGLALEARAVWSELAERDPRDAPVREAASALGYAAARAGLRSEAIGLHEAAVALLTQALADNAAAAAKLAEGGLNAAIDAAIGTDGLAPGSSLPAAVLANFDLQLGLDATPGRGRARPLLEALAVARWLRSSTGDAAAVDPAVIDGLVAALHRLAQTRLASERAQLEGWLASVRLALATLADPSFVLPMSLPSP